MALVHKYKPDKQLSCISVYVTPNNKYVVSCGGEGNFRITRLDTGEVVHVIKLHVDWWGGRCICVTSDIKYIVSSCLYEPKIAITCLKTGKVVHEIKGHTHRVTSVSVTSDNKYVITSLWDKTVRITRLDTGELVHVIKGHTDWVRSVYVNSDNKYVVSGAEDKTVRITCLKTGKLIHAIRGFTTFVQSIRVTHDNKYVIFFLDNGTLQITRLDDGKLFKKIRLSTKILSIDLSQNQHNIVAGCSDGTIHVLMTPTYMLRRQWAQFLLWKCKFELFQTYPGLTRYIGTILLLFC